jgi:hypothetical protein
MNQMLHEKWKKLFASKYNQDGDVTMGDGMAPTGTEPKKTTFYPFALEMDQHIASWMIKESPGNKVFDHFLEIPGIHILINSNSNMTNIVTKLKEKLGISF